MNSRCSLANTKPMNINLEACVPERESEPNIFTKYNRKFQPYYELKWFVIIDPRNYTGA